MKKSTFKLNRLILLGTLLFSVVGFSQDLLLGFQPGESGGVGSAFGSAPATTLGAGTGTNTSQVLTITGNTTGEIWQGHNFTLTNPVSLSPTTTRTMTMDIFSTTAMVILVKVNGGVAGAAVTAAAASYTTPNAWQTVSFTFDTALDVPSASANGVYREFVVHTYWEAGRTQFATPTAVPRPARTFSIDNIRGPLGVVAPPPVLPTPTVAAPVPPVATRPQGTVKSIFSNAYPSLTTFAYTGDLNTFNTSWCPAVTSEFLIGGNTATAMNRITGLGSGTVAGNAATAPPYQGSDLGGACEGINFRAGAFDATPYTHFHIDLWTPISTMALRNISLKFSNHNASNVEANAIEYNVTNATPLPNQLPNTDPNPGTWLSFDIPFTSFISVSGNSSARNNLAEFIISTNLGTVYYDNAYFWGAPLSTNEFSAIAFKLYPNPATNVLNIESASTIEKVSVYNLLGQEVFSRTPKTELVTLDVASLQSGVYLVRVDSDNGSSTQKFTKN